MPKTDKPVDVAAASPTIASRLAIVEAELAAAAVARDEAKKCLGDALAFGSAAEQMGAQAVVADLEAQLERLKLVAASLRAKNVLEDRDRLEADFAAAATGYDEAQTRLAAAQRVCDDAVAALDAAQRAWEQARRDTSARASSAFDLQRRREAFYRDRGAELEAAKVRFGGAP